MKKLTIRLNFSGKEKKYTAPKMVTGAVFQKTLKLQEDFDKRRDPEYLFNEYYPFLCAVFGHQFTEEQLKNGIDYREILPMSEKAIDHVIEEMELDPVGEVQSIEGYVAKRKKTPS